jgi:HTH-type transcriptional regulator/antitoxin HipB
MSPIGDITGDPTMAKKRRTAGSQGTPAAQAAQAAAQAGMPGLTFLASPAELGRGLRAAREARGMTQNDLAARARVHRTFIIDLENGKESAHLGKVLTVLMSVGLVGVLVPVEAAQTLRA